METPPLPSFLTFQFFLHPVPLTISFCVFFSLRVSGTDWYVTEAEEHCRSAGFLDGQRIRAPQLHQAGPRPESHHTGCPGHSRPSGSDGFQVSQFGGCLEWVWNLDCHRILIGASQAGKVKESGQLCIESGNKFD